MLAQSHVSELISVYEKDAAAISDEQPVEQICQEKIEEASTVTIGGKAVKQPLQGLGQARDDVLAVLHHPTLAPTLASLEQYTGLDRSQIFYGVLAAVSVYLLLGPGAQFISNLIGFAYPAYASFKAIRSQEKTDDTTWLIYWCAFTSFYLLDASLMLPLVGHFPIYWVLKTALLVALWLPQTQGALLIYTLLVDPAVTLVQKHIQ